MNRAARLFSILMLCAAACGAEPLAVRIEERIAGFQGSVSLSVPRTSKPARPSGSARPSRVRTASTIKLPIMAALFDAVAHGRARWTERLTVTKAHR